MIPYQMIRIDHHESVISREPQTAITRSARGRLYARPAFEAQLSRAERNARNAVNSAICEVVQLLLAETKNPFARSHPEILVIILENTVNPVIVQAIFDVNMNERAVFPPQQSGTQAAHPHAVSRWVHQVRVHWMAYIERVGAGGLIAEVVKAQILQADKQLRRASAAKR